MIRAIVGTAGHIDHGKTALLKALTGIDCDRLPEEKEREITIDLGFAFLKEEDVQIGFIDVPGHERFLKNLLAGISGFQFFLFCVALDEGIKAQTIEHMKILKTLELKKGIVALTKMDLVGEGEIKRRKLEVLYLFEREGFTNINLIPVSAHRGTNILNLKDELVKLIKENPPMANLNSPVIYPIDRVFTLQGKGVITTGTLIRGELKLGDELFINPSLKKIRIRGIEVHKEKREMAKAFERVALQISGVEKEDLKRGIIFSDISLPQTKLITVKLNLIKEIKEDTRLRIAHHTEEAFGRYHKIDENLAQIF
ncbi:MAG: selenocysteine-specific translation elongation factor, partial [Thermoanaerobaculia bacterium]